MLTVHRGGRRETFRRTLKEKRQLDLKEQSSRKREGDIMTIAKSPVVTMAPTTPICMHAVKRENYQIKTQVRKIRDCSIL
jgi:hypothetical protein